MPYNRAILQGNLTSDPELKYVQGGNRAVTNLRLAVNRTFTKSNGQKGEETLYIDVVAWGRMGEVISEYLSKGDPLLVDGRLKLDEWQDNQTGQNRQKIKLVADNFTFVGGGNRNNNGRGGGQRQQRAPQQQQQQGGQRYNGQQQRQQPQPNQQQPQRQPQPQRQQHAPQGPRGGQQQQAPPPPVDDDIPF